MELERHPLDYTELQKGTYVSKDVLQHASGHESSTSAYKLFVLGIQKNIKDEFISRGDPAYVKFEQDGLRILTDLEASPYIEARNRSLRSSMGYNTVVLVAIDRNAMPANEQQSHDRRVIVESRYTQALRNAAQLTE